MSETTIERFNQALMSTRASPIGAVPFQALHEKMGAVRVGQLLNSVAAGDQGATQTLHRFAAVAGLYGRLVDLGFSSTTIDQARVLLQSHPIEDVRSAVSKALNGDANAKQVLATWLARPNNSVGQPASDIPVASLPGRPTGPVTRAQVGASSPVTPTVRPSLAPPSPFPTGQVERTRREDFHPTAQIHDINVARRGPEENTDTRDVVPRTYDQAKAHGAKAALTFSADMTSRDNPTVLIEAAPILNAAERTYDWKNKLRFQLTRHELQLVTGLLFDMVPELHFSNHNEKWMTIKRQDNDPQYGGTIKFTMGVGKASENQPRTVQIDSSTIGEITSLFVRQCMALLKCDGATLAPVLRQVTKTYLTQQACRNARTRQAG